MRRIGIDTDPPTRDAAFEPDDDRRVGRAKRLHLFDARRLAHRGGKLPAQFAKLRLWHLIAKPGREIGVVITLTIDDRGQLIEPLLEDG